MKTKLFNVTSPKDDYMESAANCLKHGGIGIFPTDTVYGLGCSAFNNEAIHNLFVLKNRDYSKPINILISDLGMLDGLVANISDIEKTLMENFWPGPLTIIFPKKENISNLLTANLGTIGIRMPNHPITLELISRTNLPLATTSANISGNRPGIQLSDFYTDFNNKLNFMIDSGIANLQIPSTIVSVDNNQVKILREGSISRDDIQDVLEKTANVRVELDTKITK